MLVGTIVIKLYAPWVHSLKEKRMVVKSISSKVSNKFNVSIAEIDEQDTHQTIVLGIAYVSTNNSQIDSIYESIMSFIEENTDAEIMDVIYEAL